jgi:dTDP-4-amino-4,6-dideoxygalactose transaminase
MSDVLAAFLYAQLEVWQVIQKRRQQIWGRYHTELADWSAANDIRQPVVTSDCEQAHHMYYLLLPSLERRTALIAHLKAQGIHAVFHYLPLHLSEFAARWGGKAGDCPVTEYVSDRLLRLPFFNSITDDQQGRVIEALSRFLGCPA